MTPEEIKKSAQHTLACEKAVLDMMQQRMDDAFVTVADKILHLTGRVIVTGMGKPGHIGKKIAASLASTGTPAFFVHPAEASHGDLGMITKNDLVLALSNSGESKELFDIVNYCKRFAIPLVAITSAPDSTLGKAADYILQIPNKQEAPEACPFNMAPTTSMIATLAMGDALTVALMNMRGFTKELYHDRHPGGKLGNVLVKVKDIMAKDDALPVVPDTMKMADALMVMSKKMLGCIGILDADGHLAGMITDGDLRRHMSPDLMTKSVTDVMNPNPTTISGDILGSEALNIMNTKKITNIFVVDADNKPLGLIHMHHLLQAGVA
ncbi:MAG: KpsF/GutQ family sugar-phosphate isomerase [Alphaproteobacteria bacterium]|nr:KpsF/GutQ family sugar-phosphate isomerase [Alphaproteobacteria bacterium]